MPKPIIQYEGVIPEIPGRLPWEKPTQHLVKDESEETGWRIAEGRRPSKLLLVPKIREKVDAWRESRYVGASEVTKRLFEYWFEEDHDVPGFNTTFKYWFCQREAIETLAWLIEIEKVQDIQALIQTYATKYTVGLFQDNIDFQTTLDGRRQLRRYIRELDREGVQDLPPKDLRRFAFKMATGSGKTWVMAMAIVWAYFHKKRVPDSSLSTNFLIVAPNVIVYQRLEKDFADNSIFYELPLIPPEWRGAFSLKVVLRGEAMEPDPTGNLFLTNIQQLYESRDEEWTPANAIEAILGPKPTKDIIASSQRSMLERIKSLKDIVVINDEAHHVHNEELAWSQTLLTIHDTLPKGLTLWLDFSATPKDQNGMYFPWNVVDYPLAQAVEDRIVKVPLIVTKEGDPQCPKDDPDNVTKDNIIEKYGYWLRAAVQRWKEHYGVYAKLGIKPVLFIMTEKKAHANKIGKYLLDTKEFGFNDSEVLVIHTDEQGEITKSQLDEARAAARDIDKPHNQIKAIVSVLMLREGWDVRNVSVVLGLRPFTAKPEILPEQVIGRGLRLMTNVGPDYTQTLEVLGTKNLLDNLKGQLEMEGVGVASTKTDPPLPVTIEPIRERLKYDIAFPIAKPSLEYNFQKLSDLDVETLKPLYDESLLVKPFRVPLKFEDVITETKVHEEDTTIDKLPTIEKLLASITNKVIARAKLPNRFAELYPKVRDYISNGCFGKKIDLGNEVIRSHLARPEIQETISVFLAKEVAKLTIERKPIELQKTTSKLSQTKPFTWRRDLPPLQLSKTIFNYVATYNSYERKFAEFLDKAPDVLRFASLGTTEQGVSGIQFRVDYLKPSGAIGFYHPDWIVVQYSNEGEIYWIIETKGRIWEDTKAKDMAIKAWCERVSALTSQKWLYQRVDQKVFESYKGNSLKGLIGHVEQENAQGLFFKD